MIDNPEKLHFNSTILNHGISTQELKEFLGEDWDDYKDNPKLLELWADLLFKNNLMKQGKIPNNFTAVTLCDYCGYVYVPPALVNNGSVLMCPWCWNRIQNLPVPKPISY
jgi:hypothetical protein